MDVGPLAQVEADRGGRGDVAAGVGVLEADPPLVALLGGLFGRGGVDVEVDVVERDAVEVDAGALQRLDRRVVGVALDIRHRRPGERTADLRRAGLAVLHGGERDRLRRGVGLLEADRPRRSHDDRAALRRRVTTRGRESGLTGVLLRLVEGLARVVGELECLRGAGGRGGFGAAAGRVLCGDLGPVRLVVVELPAHAGTDQHQEERAERGAEPGVPAPCGQHPHGHHGSDHHEEAQRQAHRAEQGHQGQQTEQGGGGPPPGPGRRRRGAVRIHRCSHVLRCALRGRGGRPPDSCRGHGVQQP